MPWSHLQPARIRGKEQGSVPGSNHCALIVIAFKDYIWVRFYMETKINSFYALRSRSHTAKCIIFVNIYQQPSLQPWVFNSRNPTTHIWRLLFFCTQLLYKNSFKMRKQKNIYVKVLLQHKNFWGLFFLLNNVCPSWKLSIFFMQIFFNAFFCV